jgi:hypothetical protein
VDFHAYTLDTFKKIVSAKARPDAALNSRMYLKTEGFNNLLDLLCNPLPEAIPPEYRL